MDLKIKTPCKRVRAFYNRGELGGITLSVYDERMIGSPIATIGYDRDKHKIVLYVRNLEEEEVELVIGEG